MVKLYKQTLKNSAGNMLYIGFYRLCRFNFWSYSL